MTIETDANDLDGPAPVAPVTDDSAFKIGDAFGDGGDGAQACLAACAILPGTRPHYGINPTPSRSAIPASPRNWQWSIAAPAPKPAIDWAQFVHAPTDGAFMCGLKDARKLVALRVDRGAPESMIMIARMGLEGIEHHIRAASAARQAPPATGLIANMSPGVRAAAGLSMLAYLGVFLAKVHLLPLPDPPARVLIPGPGIGIQQNVFMPDDDTKAKLPTTRERYSAPYLVTRTGANGNGSTTWHGPRYTVTTTR